MSLFRVFLNFCLICLYYEHTGLFLEGALNETLWDCSHSFAKHHWLAMLWILNCWSLSSMLKRLYCHWFCHFLQSLTIRMNILVRFLCNVCSTHCRIAIRLINIVCPSGSNQGVGELRYLGLKAIFLLYIVFLLLPLSSNLLLNRTFPLLLSMQKWGIWNKVILIVVDFWLECTVVFLILFSLLLDLLHFLLLLFSYFAVLF